MAINTQGSSITTVTNVNNNLVDHDQFMEAKYHIEHNRDSVPQDHTPWATTYKPEQVLQEEPPSPVVEDTKLSKANKKDLKARNLNP
jgi:hypothetical protein